MQRSIAPAVLLAVLFSTASLAEVVISEAWVRAMPPTQRMTAAYLTLENRGPQAITITGAFSDTSPRVEIHTTVSSDGMQRMQPAGDVAVAAGATVEMAPGGYHLMLRDMSGMPVEGSRVEICLTLASGKPVCTAAEVSRRAPASANHHH